MEAAFRPTAAKTVNIDVSSSSQRIKITDGSSPTVRVMNDGTATAWCNFGDSIVTAAVATGFPVGPGVTEVLTPDPPSDGAALYVAAIAAGSTGKIYFTPGNGI